MKQFPLVLSISAAILSLSAATPRVVKAPEFEIGSFIFRVGAVTLSDTATRIDADIYARPDNYVYLDTNFRIESRITNKIYPVKRIEGLPLRQQIYPGDSAHLRATFVFDPLESVDSVFDFVGPDGWNVRGIDLNYRPKGITTHISGTITGRPSASWMVLYPVGEDIRVNKSIILPVDNGHFEYDLITSDTLSYEITPAIDILHSYAISYRFITEGDTVSINISGQDTPPFEAIEGGPLTKRLLDFYGLKGKLYNCDEMEEYRRLRNERLFYVSEFYNLSDRIGALELGLPERDSLMKIQRELINNPEGLSAAGKKAQANVDSLNALGKELTYRRLRTDTTLAGLAFLEYYFLHAMEPSESDTILAIYRDVYASRFPDHPYSIAINQHLSNEKAEVGCHYPDFTAPDLQGNLHRLSDHIKGKYAVIDLWASWCGPCRRHSKELIEVYEKWKDKGFTVVGIARENGDTKAMENAVAKDGYPWLNLVELNDAGQIWNRYLAGNGGGKILFVDPDGKILLINKEISEIASMLEHLMTDN